MGGTRLTAYWNSCYRCAVSRLAKRGKESSDKNNVQTAAQVNHNAVKRKTLKFHSCANSANANNSSPISNYNTFQLNCILFAVFKASTHRKR